MAEPWVLCVDDDVQVLDGLELVLGLHHEVVMATSGAEALALLAQRPRCATVISDMRMPQMDGAELLAAAHGIQPDATRILLTGLSDLGTAAAAVNQGRIFRLLTKPCRSEELLRAVDDGLAQHRLQTAERELLEQTLNGTVQLLVDVLAISSPAAFDRAAVIRQLVVYAATGLGWEASWELEIAAQLARLGWIAVPAEVIDRYLAGQPLEVGQDEMIAAAPAHAARLLGLIPRLEPAARLVREATPAAPGSEPDAIGLLRAALDVDLLMARGAGIEAALHQLHGRHHSRLLGSMSGFQFERHGTPISMHVVDLRAGMAADDDIVTTGGNVLVKAGVELTPLLIQRINNFHATIGVTEPVRVLRRNGVASASGSD